MKINPASPALAIVLALCAAPLLAQTPAQTPAPKYAAPPATGPLIADVRTAPYRPKIVFRTNLGNQRFDIRNATIFEMIEFAYALGEQDDDRENPAIVGGPTWIDFDRFDISAKLLPPKPATPPADTANSVSRFQDPNDQIRPILQRVLAERFHLKFHTEDRPLPGFVVTVAKDGPKLAAPKDPAADSGCRGEWDKANPQQYRIICTSETVAQFVSTLDQDFPRTIVDHSGLVKPYDFTLKLQLGPDVHTRDDRARVYSDAINKQLGLTVSPGPVTQPAIVVDTVDRTPTPNAPDIAKLLPGVRDIEFEVASIRPATDTEPQDQVRPGGSQITFSGMNLLGLITRAWQLPTGAMLGDALPKLPPQRYTVLVKLPPGLDGRAVNQDPDQIAAMLQKLLVDRFQIQYHWGEWTQPDAYVLAAGGTPKMKPADPRSRSFCKFGPAEGEKPSRYAGSPYDVEFHCQNVTMTQFADRLQAIAGSDIKNRVANKTGLTGAYTFTVFCTAHRTVVAQTAAAVQEAKLAGEAAAAPIAGIDLQDAFRKELGLRLEKQPLTLPALILDHFNQTPTEN